MPRFDQRGGDSFAWRQQVGGAADCGEVTLLVNGEPVPGGVVPVTGGRFSAAVPVVEGRNEVVQYVWSPDPARRAPLTTAAGGPLRDRVHGPRLRLRAPAEDGQYYARLTVTDAEGRADTATTYFAVEDGKARAVEMDTEHPGWIDSAVIYAPVPALWGDDGPAAVERRLEYLRELGVDALWLWPPAAERAPGQPYAITDYFRLDPSWGPPAAFHYFDWSHLPNLDYGNPEVRRMIVEAFAHWVREMGIDGFRVDVAWGVQQRRPDFWPELRRELKRINPDILLLAEGSATDPYFFANGFDVAYDWTGELGQWAWSSAFESPQELQRLLAAAITNEPTGYARDAIVLRFLNNNDTGERFVDRYGPRLTRVAATLQFTVPGLPALFAGDEIGASYQPYSDLAPITWRDRHGLLPFYRALVDLKHRVPALNTTEVEVLASDPGASFAYLRPAPPGGRPVLVVLNFGGPATVELTRTPALDAALDGRGGLRDLLTGRALRLEAGARSVTVGIDAESAHVLTPEAG